MFRKTFFWHFYWVIRSLPFKETAWALLGCGVAKKSYFRNPGLFFHYFSYFQQLTKIHVQHKKCPITGFEPRTSDIGSNPCANWTTPLPGILDSEAYNKNWYFRFFYYFKAYFSGNSSCQKAPENQNNFLDNPKNVVQTQGHYYLKTNMRIWTKLSKNNPLSNSFVCTTNVDIEFLCYQYLPRHQASTFGCFYFPNFFRFVFQ